MSYAIIRNTKYKRDNLKGIFRHNERRNKNYSNDNIDKEKSFELEYKYHNKIHKLEKENNHLHKIINKFWDTLEKFISWICKKFDIAEEDNLVRDFQKEISTFIDPEKQIKHEEREKEWDLEK